MISKTRHKIQSQTKTVISDKNSDLMGKLLVERLASGGLGAGRIAWLTTCQILISLCCFPFFQISVGLWLV